MHRRVIFVAYCLWALSVSANGGEWRQFRGPHGLGVSDDKDVPVRWSSTDNIAWKTDLPGPGASSPIVAGGKVYLTCYTGYGIEPAQGDDKNLRRHLLCFDRATGKELWNKPFEPKLPEHQYQGEGSYHGYAASTPCSDGERLYVFFGKSGVYGLDLDGNQLWHASVGDGTHGWGSGASPVLFNNLVLINASVESGSLYALDKLTGKEVWKAGGVGGAWNTPHVMLRTDGDEVIVSAQDKVLSFSPHDGKSLWTAEGVHRYVCPSVVSHRDVVYAIGGGHTSLAVRFGGTGDVTKSHVLWREAKGSNVGSPIYLNGHLYWAGDGSGLINCQNAETGEFVFQERLEPRPGNIWSSTVLADGKLYFVSQHAGTFVVAAKPKFELLAHNKFDDDSRTNASPAVQGGQLLLRTDKRLYCIGKQ